MVLRRVRPSSTDTATRLFCWGCRGSTICLQMCMEGGKQSSVFSKASFLLCWEREAMVWRIVFPKLTVLTM